MSTPSDFYWLSFVDTRRPPGQRFVGAVLTQAESPRDAHEKVRELGLNPAGEVQICRMQELPEAVTDKYADRLLTKPECEQFDDACPD